jgi:hypothetical protein
VERKVLGPEVFARTLSRTSRRDKFGNQWQYHSRSDHHSKVACVLILLDLLENCAALAAHAWANRIAFGINHEMRDFTHNRKKNLDLVICTPASSYGQKGETLLEQAAKWEVQFSASELSRIESLPTLRRAPVGNVLMALEAKACMTAHQKALPRLYDELNSSQLTVHGSNESAIAVGFVCINAARDYLSPDLNKRVLGSPTWSENPQPKSSEITVAKVKEIPRRSKSKDEGFDAIGIVLVDFHNDGSPVRIIDTPPAPGKGDIFYYDTMIERICGSYTTRFREL